MMNFQSFLAAIEIKDEKRGSNLVSHFQNWEFKGIQNKLFGERKLNAKHPITQRENIFTSVAMLSILLTPETSSVVESFVSDLVMLRLS